MLCANAAGANFVILLHAEKVLGIQKFTPEIAPDGQLWLIYSNPGTFAIKFILTCTEGPMEKYHIFIFSAVPDSKLTPELLKGSVKAFCDALLNEPGLSKRRMFSVFSVDLVAEAFADTWERRTNIKRIEEPYYVVIFSDDTLVPAVPPQVDGVIELRGVE